MDNKTYEQRLQELITIELLQKVFEYDKEWYINDFIIIRNEIRFESFNYDGNFANEVVSIDTFCFECKKYASKKGYIISSQITKNRKGLAKIKKRGGKFYPYRGETMQEAIIKATLWCINKK